MSRLIAETPKSKLTQSLLWVISLHGKNQHLLEIRGQGGTDLALKYINKLDIIVPCWFEIKPEILHGKFNSMIDGSNYINTQFLKEVKTKKPNAKMMPRFHCQNFNMQSIEQFLDFENRSHFFKVLIRRLK